MSFYIVLSCFIVLAIAIWALVRTFNITAGDFVLPKNSTTTKEVS